MKSPLVGFLINLRAADGVITAHHIDSGLLAALQGADHLIDKPVAHQRFERSWCFHTRLIGNEEGYVRAKW
jgi:hypothetical protein